jgi:hypothetical protein
MFLSPYTNPLRPFKVSVWLCRVSAILWFVVSLVLLTRIEGTGPLLFLIGVVISMVHLGLAVAIKNRRAWAVIMALCVDSLGFIGGTALICLILSELWNSGTGVPDFGIMCAVVIVLLTICTVLAASIFAFARCVRAVKVLSGEGRQGFEVVTHQTQQADSGS